MQRLSVVFVGAVACVLLATAAGAKPLAPSSASDGVAHRDTGRAAAAATFERALLGGDESVRIDMRVARVAEPDGPVPIERMPARAQHVRGGASTRRPPYDGASSERALPCSKSGNRCAGTGNDTGKDAAERAWYAAAPQGPAGVFVWNSPAYEYKH